MKALHCTFDRFVQCVDRRKQPLQYIEASLLFFRSLTMKKKTDKKPENYLPPKNPRKKLRKREVKNCEMSQKILRYWSMKTHGAANSTEMVFS